MRVLLPVVLSLCAAAARADSDLDARIARVLPKPDEEVWLGIPWRTNLLQARLDAQAEDKPILVWIMDGNVLGCT